MYTFFACLAPICMLSRCFLTKFLHRCSVGSLLRVRCWLGTRFLSFLSHSLSWGPPRKTAREKKTYVKEVAAQAGQHGDGGGGGRAKLGHQEATWKNLACLLHPHLNSDNGLPTPTPPFPPPPPPFAKECPTNNELSANFQLSSNTETLLLSTTEHANRLANVQKRVCNVYIFRWSFRFCVPALVVGSVFVCVCV